jgi:hypothetical protein
MPYELGVQALIYLTDTPPEKGAFAMVPICNGRSTNGSRKDAPMPKHAAPTCRAIRSCRSAGHKGAS